MLGRLFVGGHGMITIRPIGKITTYRKIVDVAQQLSHRQDLQKEFGDVQYCGASFRAERMQNSMNVHLTILSDLSCSSFAFCHADLPVKDHFQFDQGHPNNLVPNSTSPGKCAGCYLLRK